MTATSFELWLRGESSDDDGAPIRESAHHPQGGVPITALSAAEAALLARIQDNDPELARMAFTEMYREYLPALVALAQRYVKTVQVAEDIVANVFVSLWCRRQTWSPRYGIRVYLYRVVRTRALDHLRNVGTAERLGAAAAAVGESPGVSSISPPIDESVDTEYVLAAAAAAIASFPDLRRQVMELRWQHGLAIEEIAATLSLSRAAVDQHLSRGLRALRQLLPEALGK